MILEPFSCERHPVREVASLVYDTEPVYFSLVFGRDRTEALRKIQNVIQAGGNAFGHENITCAVQEGRVIGILILLTPHAPGLTEEFCVIVRAAGPATALRFLLAEWLMFAPHYLEKSGDPEYHISNLSVIPTERGMGVGAVLLENAIRTVRSGGGGKIMLNVIDPNPAAVRVYEKTGFQTISVRRAWVPFRFLVIRTMVYDTGPHAASRPSVGG